ncbi:hypothetical protein PR001_g5208 [Phytophthora rubi]|uniref:Uncharacterized protein n=1 Tax=Phytophthora rubi TaxID=129364 RepID=A0A6A3NNI0_9STRA|nr:hypothetical protein PR002_g5677 [Phytophthora rubi]KAE9044825.1 hypothetical protein PR001_g5208 [Phytophthora rubi]
MVYISHNSISPATDQEVKDERNDEDESTPQPSTPLSTQPLDLVHHKEPAFYVGGVDTQSSNDAPDKGAKADNGGVLSAAGASTGGRSCRAATEASSADVIISGGERPGLRLTTPRYPRPDDFIPVTERTVAKRFYTKVKGMKYDPLSRSSPDVLLEAWDVFVQALVVDEAAWMR